MSRKSKAIVKTFRQILDIYKQINMLMKTSKKLMEARKWKTDQDPKGNEEHYYEFSHDFSPKVVRIPFYLQQPFTSNSERMQIKYITVMIDDETPSENFEPVVVGTTLKFVNTRKNTVDWDGYWWYHWKWNETKGSDSERYGPWTLENREVNEIQKQDWIKKKNAVRSNLQSVQTFGIPLVEVKDQKSLEKEIIIPLLAV